MSNKYPRMSLIPNIHQIVEDMAAQGLDIGEITRKLNDSYDLERAIVPSIVWSNFKSVIHRGWAKCPEKTRPTYKSNPSNRVKTFTQPMRDKIYEMASQGINERKIADAIAIDMGSNVTVKMLQYRCPDELRSGFEVAIAKGLIGKRQGVPLGLTRTKLTEEEQFQLKEMAAHGLPNEAIATILGIGKMTLQANYMELLQEGRTHGHKKVASTLFQMANDGEHPASTAFYLKAKCGWKETNSIEFPDKDGNPQEISKPAIILSDQQLDKIIKNLNETV